MLKLSYDNDNRAQQTSLWIANSKKTIHHGRQWRPKVGALFLAMASSGRSSEPRRRATFCLSVVKHTRHTGDHQSLLAQRVASSNLASSSSPSCLLATRGWLSSENTQTFNRTKNAARLVGTSNIVLAPYTETRLGRGFVPSLGLIYN